MCVVQITEREFFFINTYARKLNTYYRRQRHKNRLPCNEKRDSKIEKQSTSYNKLTTTGFNFSTDNRFKESNYTSLYCKVYSGNLE